MDNGPGKAPGGLEEISGTTTPRCMMLYKTLKACQRNTLE